MFEECPDCQGWTSDETGRYCMTCGDTGQIWVDVEQDFDEGDYYSAPPWCGGVCECGDYEI